jgi:hypothetical protein
MDSQSIIRHPRQELFAQLRAQLRGRTPHRTIWLDRPYNLYLDKKQAEGTVSDNGRAEWQVIVLHCSTGPANAH